jgi:hypothetical protein
LYSLFNKIRDKGKIVSDCQRGGKGEKGGGRIGKGGGRGRGRNDPNIVCTYE